MDREEIQRNAEIMQKVQQYKTMRFNTAMCLLAEDFPRLRQICETMSGRCQDPEDEDYSVEEDGRWDEDDCSAFMAEGVGEALWAAESLILQNDSMDIPFLGPRMEDSEDLEGEGDE